MKKILLSISMIFFVFFTSCVSIAVSSPNEITIDNMYDDYYSNSNNLSYQEANNWKNDLDDAHYLFETLIQLNEDGRYENKIANLKNQIYTMNKSYIDTINSRSVSGTLSSLGQGLQGASEAASRNTQVGRRKQVDVYLH